MLWVGLHCVIVAFPDYTHLLSDVSLGTNYLQRLSADNTGKKCSMVIKLGSELVTIQSAGQFVVCRFFL